MWLFPRRGCLCQGVSSAPCQHSFSTPASPLQAVLSTRACLNSRLTVCGPIEPQEKEPLMAQHIRELMTPNPVALPGTASVHEAACAMRDAQIGDVIVIEHNE